MKTIEYLSDPALRPVFLPAIIVVVAIGVLCSLTSVLVVLRRMAFVGQGVSHAALGGVGLAAALGLMSGSSGTLGPVQFGVIVSFCMLAGLTIGWMSKREGSSGNSAHVEPDTAIGVVLVVSMSVGAILLQKFSPRGVAWESFLFGSVLQNDARSAWMAWAVALASVLWLVMVRRRLTFWAFDPSAARAMGVRDTWLSMGLMLLLSVATVTAMQLAGVVLATAMLVLPGATALALSKKLRVVLAIALGWGVLGGLLGVVLSFELDWLPGATIVSVLGAGYALALGVRTLLHRSSRHRSSLSSSLANPVTGSGASL
jgi:ABC-type Mn2+/Zn2+ transport system permease subunit